jgi:hypothetical protein
MGTMIDRLPATQVDAEAPSYGIYLQAVAGWKEACTVIPDPCLADAGCPRLDLPDGGHMLNPDVCGVHYSLRPPYRGDACNVGGTVEHCEVWARDGGVVASHAFCSD